MSARINDSGRVPECFLKAKNTRIVGRSVVRLAVLHGGDRRLLCSTTETGMVVLRRSQRLLPQR